MKCDELKDYDIMDIEAIDDERIKASSNGEVVPSTRVYIKADVDKRIDELKDKIQMHDFFWEGCGFDKLGFNNSIQVREEFDKLKAENESLKEAQRWRKCSEELPPCSGIYFVCVGGHARTIDIFLLDRKLWRNYNPTHWMPLPKGPEGK